MHGRNERRIQAAEQAAQWLLTLQETDVSSREQGEFIDWLRESPLHVAELLHAARLQRRLSAFGRWNEIEALQERTRDRIATLLPAVGEGRRGFVVAPNRRHRPAQIACAAAVMLMAAFAWVMLARRAQIVVLSTQPTERRTVTLADGSVVTLAPNTRLCVRLRPRERLVTLQRGEALFQDTDNPYSPFVVRAGNMRIRAVGTSFDVDRGASSVAVIVAQGEVQLTASPPLALRFSTPPLDAPAPLRLLADEKVTVSQLTGASGPVKRINGEQEVAWASGRLEFDDEPITEVASRFNHFNHVQIHISDPSLAARRVSGSFAVDDPNSFVAFIESVASIRTIRHGTDWTLIGRRADDEEPHRPQGDPQTDRGR